MSHRMPWRDPTRAQQSGALALLIMQLALLSAALIDIRRRSPTEVHGSRRLWTAAAFVNFIGPLAYFAFGRKR